MKLRFGISAVVVIAVFTATVALAPAALARGTIYDWHCGSWHTWTDGYSGDTVNYRGCIGKDQYGTWDSKDDSYITHYNSNRPINPYHVRVWFYGPGGSLNNDGTCDRGSAPVGSSNTYICYSGYGVGTAGSTTKSQVALFYTSGQLSVSPTISFTY
jgi:hypothetical protein